MDKQEMRKKIGRHKQMIECLIASCQTGREASTASLIRKCCEFARISKKIPSWRGPTVQDETGVLMCGKAFLLTASVTASPGAYKTSASSGKSTIQTHPSQRLDPRCSLLKGLRDERGDTTDLNTFLIALSGACWFGLWTALGWGTAFVCLIQAFIARYWLFRQFMTSHVLL